MSIVSRIKDGWFLIPEIRGIGLIFPNRRKVYDSPVNKREGTLRFNTEEQ